MMLLALLLVSSLSTKPDCNLRMTCVDGAALYSTYKNSLNELESWAEKLKRLASDASGTAISEADRMYMQREAEAVLEEINRIILQSVYVDSFGESHSMMRDGIRFWLSYKSIVSDRFLHSRFKLSKMSPSLRLQDINLTDTDSALDSLQRVNSALDRLLISERELDRLGRACP